MEKGPEVRENPSYYSYYLYFCLRLPRSDTIFPSSSLPAIRAELELFPSHFQPFIRSFLLLTPYLSLSSLLASHFAFSFSSLCFFLFYDSVSPLLSSLYPQTKAIFTFHWSRLRLLHSSIKPQLFWPGCPELRASVSPHLTLVSNLIVFRCGHTTLSTTLGSS